MKKHLRYLSAALALVLLFCSVPAAAAQKKPSVTGGFVRSDVTVKKGSVINVEMDVTC